MVVAPAVPAQHYIHPGVAIIRACLRDLRDACDDRVQVTRSTDSCTLSATVSVPCSPSAGSRQNVASDLLRVRAAGQRVADGRFNGAGRPHRILTFPAGALQTSECATGLQRFPVTADCPSRRLPAATVRRSDPVAFHARPKLPRQDLGCRKSRSAARPYDAEIRTYYDRARN